MVSAHSKEPHCHLLAKHASSLKCSDVLEIPSTRLSLETPECFPTVSCRKNKALFTLAFLPLLSWCSFSSLVEKGVSPPPNPQSEECDGGKSLTYDSPLLQGDSPYNQTPPAQHTRAALGGRSVTKAFVFVSHVKSQDALCRQDDAL